jgi:protein-L-isoaspartate(D-aspartate) O-methyltransferase
MMVEDQIIARSVLDQRVIEAMRSVPRHLFVPGNLQKRAYDDTPLPIGHGQTISQPYIVAYMSELLELRKNDRILEVGTGSGYQAAILSAIIGEVYTIEIIEPLAQKAAETFKKTGYTNIHVKTGDGYYGWEEHAPYDGIIVTAAAEHIPPPLIDQLKEGGKIIIPVGEVYEVQTLMTVIKHPGGKIETRKMLPVRFVPLTSR